jgi:hypothetical protein
MNDRIGIWMTKKVKFINNEINLTNERINEKDDEEGKKVSDKGL